MAEIKTKIPENAFAIINELVKRGYYSSVADFARQSILDKLINDFEIGISELEPEIVGLRRRKREESSSQALISNRKMRVSRNAEGQI